MAILQVQTGPVGPVGDGTYPNARGGKLGDIIISQLHGRYYESCYRGNQYCTGTTGLVALSANTITLTASTTPIIGLYNPSTSTVNAVIQQAMLIDELNNVTSVAPGAFVWAASIGNSAISTGLTPFNRKTLTFTGSFCKGFAGATALTGLTNNLVIFESADFDTSSSLLTTTVAASTPTPSASTVHFMDGSLFVPPGGVLALLNTVSTTTHSIAARLLWEEVPV